ncbi:MAG: 30S ribosomal protein S7 [Candidatus Woesearchaeota archaeon]|nr:30S ribosomal protein S7 [Candidatus Woesearchaeota archaeon]
MTEILVFNRWSSEGITIEDPGLQGYISTKPVIAPKTGARYAGNRFHKSRVNIVERLLNKLMVPGHRAKKHKVTSGSCTGKSVTAYKIMEQALEIVERKTKKNPIEVLVKAVEYGAPREEIITIEYGGARYPKAVECAPQRRIDQVLKLLAQTAYQKAFNSKKSSAAALADEIVLAYQMNQQSAVIAKKLELERQADGSR